jgi:putative transposase
MILQRLMTKFTLARAVQCLAQRDNGSSAEGDKRMSLGPAGYCRARQKVPTLVARQVLEQIAERLYGCLPAQPILPERSVFVCDGSTLTLPHSAELVKAYPPHRNQRASASHWPLLRMVVLQEVQTGVASSPQWGPETVSEQALALRAIADLPAGAVLLGDRNFGVFGVAFAASQHGHAVVIRLTRVRAERLAGGSIEPGSDMKITWTPTRWDSCGGPYDSPAAVTGRLVCIAASHANQSEAIYLFTTLDLAARKIGELYALRWNVETDLRSIKQTVHLRELSARSVDLPAKELLLAFATYNLVRAVICLAAEKAQVAPRRISFTNVYTLLETFASDLYAHRNSDASDPFGDRIIHMAAQYKLPNRTQSRSYPRAVWPRPNRFPPKHAAS